MMRADVWLTLPLSQSNVIREMGGRFRPGGSPVTAGQFVIFLVAVVVLLGIAWWWARRWRGDDDRVICDSGRLFDQLSRAHKLNRVERRALWRVALQQRDVEPASLFLLKDRLLRAEKEEASASRREILHQLIEKLFHDDSAASSAPPEASSSTSSGEGVDSEAGVLSAVDSSTGGSAVSDSGEFSLRSR